MLLHIKKKERKTDKQGQDTLSELLRFPVLPLADGRSKAESQPGGV